ncbi:MAG TPA: amidase [Polyangiales bacterium]|nr:amidase [Polyangiales bacterium]
MSKTVHAFSNDVLADHDAVELARLVREREVSAAELTRAAIARAERVQPSLAAIAYPAFEEARTAAGGPLEGAFAGVPTFVKDTTNVRGVPTRLGSQAIGSHPAKADAAFTKLMKSQGMVVLGKSCLPELGFNATTEPQDGAPTRNPWNTEYSSGGSSGGSAALVASGVVAIAHGNDGGGSLRIPAACCGLFGLKPTRGRMPMNEAARQLPLDIVCEGVITRSVRDTAHFYAQTEQLFPNRKLPPIGLVEGPSNKRLRIGMVLDSVEADPTDAATRTAVLDVAKHLESLGHTVSEVQLPEEARTLPSDFSLYWAMIAFLSTTFGKLSISRDFDASRVEGLTRGLATFYKSRMLKTGGAMYRLARSKKIYARTMVDYDAMLSPVVAHTTPKLGHLAPGVEFETLFPRLSNYCCFTPLNNATGSPGMSLPLAATSDGLPLGVHFSGKHGDERTLLELAYELEQSRPFRRIQNPPIPAAE